MMMNRREALAEAGNVAAAIVAGSTVETVESKRPLALKITLDPNCTDSDIARMAGQWQSYREHLPLDNPLRELTTFFVRRGIDDVEIIEDPRGA